MLLTISLLAVGATITTGVSSSRADNESLSSTSDTTFKPVKIGAGGFVTGMSVSDDGTTRLVRTDTYGGYRWSRDSWDLDASANSLPASDISPGLGGGVLAVAVAPSDGSVAYMAYNDSVYRSGDAGRTWTSVLSHVSTAANDDFRSVASRLTVDPRDPRVVYYGSQLDGMYITHDAGASWNRVPTSSLPAGALVNLDNPKTRGSLQRPTHVDSSKTRYATAGINWVVVDRTREAASGPSPVLYAASYGNGLYRSDDAGASWSKISPNGMAPVISLRVQSNGDLVAVTHADSGNALAASDVWRLHDGTWSTTVPSTRVKNWKAVAADPSTPGRVVLMAPGGQLALSSDFGTTWTLLPRTETSDGDVPWLAWALNGGTNYMSVGELMFDPVVPGRLWLTEGTGVWFADLGARPTVVNWTSQSRGIEQLAPNGVMVPPGGKPVMTAWDRPIFRSEDPDVYPTHYGPINHFGSAWTSDYSLTDPSYLVASVASHQAPSDPSNSGFSTDGGQTWAPFPTIPDGSKDAVKTFGFGAVAVSTPGDVVWVPAYGHRPQYTLDGGKTWRPVDLPGITDYSTIAQQPYYVDRRVIVADKATPGVFYLYVLKSGTYRSTDGGQTWTKMSDDSAMKNTAMGWNAVFKAAPGHQGELFATPGPLAGTTSQAFFHSTDGGAAWSRVANVTGVTAFGFGKAFPDSEHPALYIAGYVSGTYGVYRSIDDAESWTLLTTYPTGRTSRVGDIDGDKDIEGRFYLSLSGSGWAYGDLTSTTTPEPQSPVTQPPATQPPVTQSPVPETPSPSPQDPGTPDPGPAPSLHLTISAPASVTTGKPFTAEVSASSEDPLTYSWSIRGCRLAHPARTKVRVVCVSTHGASRRLRVDARTPSGISQSAQLSVGIEGRSGKK